MSDDVILNYNKYMTFSFIFIIFLLFFQFVVLINVIIIQVVFIIILIILDIFFFLGEGNPGKELREIKSFTSDCAIESPGFVTGICFKLDIQGV